MPFICVKKRERKWNLFPLALFELRGGANTKSAPAESTPDKW
jgi:hypothetical protein